MDNRKKYKISLFGEFIDKSIESDFLANSRSGTSRTTAYIALIFGFICILFLNNDYFAVESIHSFLTISLIRGLFVLVSVTVFFGIKRIMKHTNFFYLITVYQTIIVISYLFILKQYDTLSFLSVLGLMVISLAIYLLPNKIILSLIISVILSILFFLYPIQKIEGLNVYDVYMIISYQIILLIYCNIKNCLTESYKRKQFAASRELLALSVMDPLTGIYNRARLDDEMDRWIDFSERYGNSLSLILFDIDNFKGINDSYGHLVGDSVIKNIVSTINKSIRNTDVFARWGGDEFAILLPNTDILQAEEMAERMRICICNNLYESEGNITCSFGVATYEKDDTAKSLLRKADELLLQAKASEKDRVVSQLIDKCL